MYAQAGWRPQIQTMHAPERFSDPEAYRLNPALDSILERARRRYEATHGTPCPLHDPSTCRGTCDCRECFINFYYPEQAFATRRRACTHGPECSRFRELHTVVHTATAAKHIELLLGRAAREGVVDAQTVFASRNGVVASYGCGGAADLIGALAWASRNYADHAASSLILRGCDAVAGWFDLGAEAVALTVGRAAPWTRGVVYQFAPVDRRPTEKDLMMLDGADIVLFSWMLTILEQEGILQDMWPRIVARLRPGALIVITDRWEPADSRDTLAALVDAHPRLESAWGVGDFNQDHLGYHFSDEVIEHRPRIRLGALGIVARVI